MNIFDPHITGSLSVSASAHIEGDLTVLGTIRGDAQITGEVDSAISASHAASYLLTSSFEGVSGSFAITGSNNFKGDQTISGSLLPEGTLVHDIGSESQRWNDIYLAGSTIDIGGTKISKNDDGDVQFHDSGNTLKKIIASEIQIGHGNNRKTLKVSNGRFKLTGLEDIEEGLSNLSGSFTGSFVGDGSQLINVPASGVTGLSLDSISNGSNSLTMGETVLVSNVSILPNITDTIDLGSPDKQWRDLFLSSGSLYINGQQVLSTTGDELRITTDTGESIKIIETSTDTITLQTEDGDITLTASGNGNIELDAPIQIGAGNKILSSDGNEIQFGNGLSVTGSVVLTGTVDGVDIAGLNTTFNSFTSSTNGAINVESLRINSLEEFTASIDDTYATDTDVTTLRTDLNTYTSSNDTTNTNQDDRLDSLETKTGSLDSADTEQKGRLDSIENFTSSVDGQVRSDFNTYTASNDSNISTLNTHKTTVEGGLEFTGSNVTIKGNLLVKGTETRVNSTTVDLDDNIISLNGTGASDAGIEVRDVTSPGILSGSLLWDGVTNYWKGGTKGNEERLLDNSDLVSLDGRLDSIETTTSSFDGRLDSLETTTGSLKSQVSSLEGFTASIDDTYASDSDVTTLRTDLNTYTSSNDTNINTLDGRLDSLETESGSVKGRLEHIEIATGSLSSDISTLDGRLDSVETKTGSLSSDISTLDGRVDTIESQTGSYQDGYDYSQIGHLPLSGGSGVGQAMTGNLHIQNGGPKIYLKDTTDDDDQAIYFQNNAGTTEYIISTQDFTSGGLADGMFIGSVSGDELGLVTNNTTALYIDTSQNSTFSGHIIPKTDATQDLGTTNSLDFRTLYVRNIDIFNQRVNISSTGTIATFSDHTSVGDGIQFNHLGTEILRLGNGSSTTATFAGTIVASGYNDGNWNTAYGWGDHSTEGYIKSFTDTNEFVSGVTFNSADGVLTFTRNNGGDTFTVDIDGRYSLLNHVHTFASLTSKPTTLSGYGITDAATSTQGSNADTAFGWGNHASVGYITGFTNTNEFVSGATFNSGNGVITFTRNNGGDTFTVDIDGRHVFKTGDTMTGTLIVPTLQIGNATFSRSGDQNHVHFVGTALIPNTSTTSSNSNMGTSTYRWKGVYGGLGDFSGIVTASGGNSGNWNTAYGWGDHSTEGYLTAHPTVVASASSNNGGRTYIQDILLDGFGHITGITTATETVVDTNNFVTGHTWNSTTGVLTTTLNDGSTTNVNLVNTLSDVTVTGGTYASGTQILTLTKNDGSTVDVSGFAIDTDVNWYTTGSTFNSTNGVITFTRSDGGTYTVDIDGRYLTSYTETDTLGSVTDRGSTTTNGITVGELTTTKISTSTDSNLYLYPTGNGHLYLGDSGNGMNMYHYSQQNNGKYTTFTHNGTYYRISPTATSGLEITSNTRITGTLTASGYNDANWNTAYGWGNHASAGYISSFTDTNEFVTGATFNTGNGIITFTRNNGGDTFTVDIDGRFLDTRAQVHSELYSSGGDANDYTEFGIYRNYGSNGPIVGHNTILHVSQTDGNYGFQLGGSTVVNGDGLYFRNFAGTDTITGSTWYHIATRDWVGDQNYVTTTGYNNGNWDTAYGWGNHASAGYASSSHTHSAADITSGKLSNDRLNWNVNDNFSGTYSLLWNASDSLYTAAWLQVRGSDDTLLTKNIVANGSVTGTNLMVSNWNTAYGWGDHSTEGYIKSFTNTNEFVTGATFNSGNGIVTFTRNNGGDTFNVDIDGRFSLSSHNHDGDYIQDGGSSAIGDINTIGTESIKHRWNNSTVGRPASSQTNEYGTVTTLTYDSLWATQIAWDIHDSNLYGRTLDVTNNTGTWSKFFTDSNFTDNSTNWDTAYGWGNHASAGYLTTFSESDTLATVTSRGSISNSQITLGSGGAWTPLTINKSSNEGTANAGVAIALDGTDYSEYGYRFKANGSNYYQVLYDGSTINWKHYNSGYISKMSLTNTGNLTLVGTLTASGYNDSNWNTAYGWGNHASAGYLTSITGPISGDWWNGGFISVGTDGVMEVGKYLDFHTSDSGGNNDFDLRVTAGVGSLTVGGTIAATGGNSTQWNTAYGWGNHASAGYASNTNVSNWDTAYGWGNHASAGYLTSFTETNSFLGDGGSANTHPGTNRVIFTGQVSAGSGALGMPTVDNSNAFLNINRHSGEYNSQLGFSSNGHIYYRKFSAAAINGTQPWLQVYHSGVFTNNSSNWNTAYGWGNHASAGYLTSYTDTNEFVTGATFNGSNGIVTFTRNNGGDTFTLNLASTLTDVTVTGGTYTSGTQTLRLTKSDGNTIDVSGFAIDTDTNTNNYTTGATFNTGNGIITGTLNGGGTWTVDIDGRFAPTAHNHHGTYMKTNRTLTSINTIDNGGDRYDPSADNPTNEHYAVLTYGNGGNVTGQLATHFVTGDLYSRGYNTTWSTWKKYFNTDDFTTTNISNWNAAYGWGNHANAGYITSPNGGNADTLDSLDSTQFLRSDVSDTHTATLTVNGQFIFNSSLNSSYREGIRLNVSTTGWGAAVIGGQRNSISGITDGWWVARNPSKDFVISYGTSANSGGLYLPYNSSALEYKNNRIWNESDFTSTNISNWNTAYGWGNHASGGYATLSGSNSFTNSYNEFGNGTGSVSNDGSWNARVNIAGTSHARLDVKSVSDGIITTMFSHIGHAAGKVGTYSNHPLKLVINGIDKATLDSGGGFTLVGGLTSTTVNTGQGATEVHLMNQNVRTTDSPTFSTLNATSLVATSTVSGSTVLDIQGTQGQLFSITDDLTGDLFSVSDSSGVPIFNVNANGTVSIDTLGLLTVGGSITGTSFVKSGGTSSEFLKADGSVDSTTYLSSLPSHTHTFASLTSKPTTLSGYGITDAATSTQGSNADTAFGWGDHGLSAQDKTDIGNLSGTNTGDQDLSSYLTSYTETDTLGTVIGRGNSTTGAISFTGTGANTGIMFNSTVVANDGFGIRVNGTSNAGEMEFYSTDDDDEPFVFRHYTSGQDGTGTSVEWFRIGAGGNITSTGTITASNFSGTSSGTNTGDQDLSGYASNTNVSNWDTAYGWGDHASAGYTSNTGTLTDSNDRNYITDSRGAARAPSYYDDRYAQWDFQNVSDTGVGGDGWHALLTVSKWASFDASHRQEQLIFSGDHLWRRTATSDSAWGTNKKIWDSGNLTNNSSDWDTAVGWGDHGLSAQDKIDIGNLSGINTGDQTNISGNAATADYATSAGSASNIDNVGFTNSNSGNAQAADSINNNGISYVSGFPNLSGNASDGALYSQAYSSQWQHQIYGDYRVGGIWVRGKNSNTWQSWKKVALVNSTTFTNVLGVAFTHGLDTKNLVVQVYDTNDNLFFPSDINVTDTEVNIDFAKPRSGRVVVTG
jgi:hypothetical protein